MIASMSTRLIDAQPHEVDAHIDRALAELGEHVGADRAYVVITGGPVRKHGWCRDGVSFPANWPDQVPALVARFQATTDGVIQIRSMDQLPGGTDKDVLAAAGLRSWMCVSKSSKSGQTIILGFDALCPGTITQCAEVGLLRMALDAIANVLVREHLLHERARLETNLQQAHRMETVGALTSGIAHNFNNIVGAILGYTEMAESQYGSDAGFAPNLREIRRAGERARDLVEQILAFGRRREVGRKPVALKELMVETKSLLVAALPTQIEVPIGDVPQAAVISGHPGQVQQVILNLCNNAAQAMNQIGRIEITTEVLEIKVERSFTHGFLTPGRYVRVAVSDSGRGIDEAFLGRVFEPFFTTRLAGSGLGLVTVREIVQEHAGVINIWTMPGVGSRFEVWLPCIAAAPSPSRDNIPHPALGHGETVLLVDDTSGRLLAEEELLAALGYEAVGFPRVSDALAACRTTPKRFDLLVVGHLAGATSTIDLVAALRAVVPNVPILLATTSTDKIDADRLVEIART